ncbi:hypothetical protein KKB18_12965, partial [bacterium]|nr:hypothetical protein [bacterium]
MTPYNKKIFFIVLIILSITLFGYSEDQFQVEIKCDKEVYYSRDLPDITIALENKGEERNIDLYIAYSNPYGLLFFSDTCTWYIYPNPDWSNPTPDTYISNIKIPQGFNLPPLSISRYFIDNVFPKFDMPSSSRNEANPFVFGNYTFYMAVVNSETNDVMSNISTYQIEFRKLPEKNWSFIQNKGINDFAWDNDTIWGTSGNGVSIFDTKTGSYEYLLRYGGLIDGAVLDIAVDSKGRKWFLN